MNIRIGNDNDDKTGHMIVSLLGDFVLTLWLYVVDALKL